MGSNREKFNIAIAILEKWRIWTYPISPFKKYNNYRLDKLYFLYLWFETLYKKITNP